MGDNMIPILIIWLLFSPFLACSPPIYTSGPETDEKIIAAMKYHGTSDAYEIKKNVWRFMRDGIECKLFTVSFEKSYGG